MISGVIDLIFFFECGILYIQMNKDFELEKLKIELRHIKGMYAVAQNEVLDATKKVNCLLQYLVINIFFSFDVEVYMYPLFFCYVRCKI